MRPCEDLLNHVNGTKVLPTAGNTFEDLLNHANGTKARPMARRLGLHANCELQKSCQRLGLLTN